LQNLTKTINNFKNHKNVQGKTGIAINAYLEEVHLNLIAGLQQICVQYERMVELYELNASLIDSDKKAKLPSEELQFCQSDIRLRYSEMEYVIYDFNEIIRQISGDVKGLILVNKTTATDSVVFIQDYINQNRNSIETFDANFCSTLISPLEDLILSTDKLIRRYETKQKKIENPGTYNNRITNYTKGDISKLSEAVEFTKAFTECAAFQDANKELLDQAEDNHIDYLEANKDEAEARKKAGLTKMVTGAGEIALIGLTVATAGAAAPVATIVMLGGVGLTTVNVGANIYQGYQEYQLGSAGDTTTKTNHLILDGLFGGNEGLYLAYNVAGAAMFVGGYVMSYSGAVKAGETVRLESEAVSDVSKGMKATSKIAEVEDGINAVEVGKISESGRTTVIYGSDDIANYQYNMIENPGPLAEMPSQPAKNFYGGRYNVEVLTEDRIYYRGGSSDKALGQWFTTEPPESVAKVRIDTAVKPQWIDPLTGELTGESVIDTVYAIKIPKGTTVYTGPVGSQGGAYCGGYNIMQTFIKEPWKLDYQVISKSPLK
ncbi:MAG: hypothetical protein IIT46_00740, partial [Lachnospiraceae bacterium]|nr:hypothetical protein [Lachnospiraceae bacterium]